jgi:hypothetical protein
VSEYDLVPPGYSGTPCRPAHPPSGGASSPPRLKSKPSGGSPETLTASVTGNFGEVADDSDNASVVVQPAASDTVWKVGKDDGAATPLATQSGNLHNLSGDGECVHWLQDTSLWRLNLASPALPQIATGATGYAMPREPGWLPCRHHAGRDHHDQRGRADGRNPCQANSRGWVEVPTDIAGPAVLPPFPGEMMGMGEEVPARTWSSH